jgi:regulator of sirC expression with transglutaminase-like and TPR domain
MSSWEDSLARFCEVVAAPEPDIDLAYAAFLIASLEYPQLDLDEQLGVLDSLASGALHRLGSRHQYLLDPLFCLNTLSEYLFDEVGFQGDRENYYDPRNSFLNDVLSRRRGIPISLSLLCIEVGKRLGIPVIGIGMPGHFLVRHKDQDDLFVDPFYKGILLSEEECAQRLKQLVETDFVWDTGLLDPVGNREILTRVLRNLKAIYRQSEDHTRLLKVVELLVVLRPGEPLERRDRGLAHFALSHWKEAGEDLQFFLDAVGPGEDVDAITRLMTAISRLQSEEQG